MRWVVALVAGMSVGCGRLSFDPLGGEGLGDDAGPLVDAPPDDLGAPACAFPAPVPAIGLNTPANEWEVAFHPNGELIVFTSTNLTGDAQLFTARQTAPGEFTDVAPVTDLNQGGQIVDAGPAWNGDGTRLYFASTRDGNERCYVSEYTAATNSFGPPSILVGIGDCLSITVSADEREIFFSNFAGDLSYATRAGASGPFTDQGLFAAAGAGTNGWPSLSRDGLTLYWERDSAGVGSAYFSTRPSLTDAWSPGAPVPELDGIEAGDPEISPDGRILATSRVVGITTDIFMSVCP